MSELQHQPESSLAAIKYNGYEPVASHVCDKITIKIEQAVNV